MAENENENDIITQLMGLIGTYGEIRNEVVGLYYQAMRGCSVSELTEAIVEWMIDEEKCTKKPKPGDLWRIIKAKRFKPISKQCHCCFISMGDRNDNLCEICGEKVNSFFHDIKMKDYMAQSGLIWVSRSYEEHIVAYCNAQMARRIVH